ncbi:hypothetical protein Pmani_031183 [Petrolisthes manimaculis]|uniref:Uncharacterized protein n=1 Tax=Petrolisthes manimaculis TaxID=1843537 RepID=A0AAE1NVM9_9EUCA|nr:hypothetical protein Pmani_031183 [Petrolisthes manimaculis]
MLQVLFSLLTLPFVLALQSALSLCSVPGCSDRITTDGHRQCSLHADCWSPDGFDPEARNSFDSYALLRKAWTRATKMRVKHGFDPTWRNSALGTSLAILRQRTISSERPPSDPLPALESECEEEDAAPVRSPSPSPPPGTPSFASSPSAHKSRESPKRDSKDRKDRREKRKRRDREGHLFLPYSSEKEIPLLHP